jgi:hypothetical protein
LRPASQRGVAACLGMGLQQCCRFLQRIHLLGAARSNGVPYDPVWVHHACFLRSSAVEGDDVVVGPAWTKDTLKTMPDYRRDQVSAKRLDATHRLLQLKSEGAPVSRLLRSKR